MVEIRDRKFRELVVNMDLQIMGSFGDVLYKLNVFRSLIDKQYAITKIEYDKTHDEKTNEKLRNMLKNFELAAKNVDNSIKHLNMAAEEFRTAQERL